MDIRKKSQKQEKRTAKEFGGRTQVASGALSGAKGDVRTGERNGSNFNENDFLIENKFTDKDYYQLRLVTWKKIDMEAINDNMRMSAMQIDIQDFKTIIIDLNTFETLFDSNLIFVSSINLDSTRKSINLKKETLERHLAKVRTRHIPFCIKINFSCTSLVLMELNEFFDLKNSNYFVDTTKLPLPDGEHAKIDAEDFQKCKSILWSKNKRGYVIGKVNNSSVRLHRFILNITDANTIIDHKDRDKLNNSKHNLRHATPKLNSINRGKFNISTSVSSQYKGVSMRRSNHKWKAYIRVDGVLKTLGEYPYETQAGFVYDCFAKRYFGKDAVLNNIPSKSIPNIEKLQEKVNNLLDKKK